MKPRLTKAGKQWLASYGSYHFSTGNTPFGAYASLYRYMRGMHHLTAEDRFFVRCAELHITAHLAKREAERKAP